MPLIAQRVTTAAPDTGDAAPTPAGSGVMPASSTMPGQYMRGTFGNQTMVPGRSQSQFGAGASNLPTQYMWPSVGVSPVVQKVALNNTPQQPVPAPPVQPGQPYQIISVDASSEPYKTTAGAVMCAVSCSFQENPGDPNFTNCRIWFVGYHGSTTPQLMAEGPTSPISFLADPTGENVTVYAEAISNQGKTSQGPVTTWAPKSTIDLAGTVGIPPTPSIAQTLTGTPTGYQFAFNQLAGLAANVIDGYAIYRNTTDTPSGSTQIQYIKQNPANDTPVLIMDQAGQGQFYFYWVSAFDTSGNESDLLSAQSGSISPLSTFTPAGQVYGPATISGIAGAQMTMAAMHDSVGLTLSSNLLQNANFAGGNVGWTVPAGFAIVNGPGHGPNGEPWYAEYTGANTTPNNLENSQRIPCSPGNVVSASCKISGASGAPNTSGIFINWFDGNNTYLGTSSGNQVSPNVGWVTSRVVNTAPAGTVYCTVGMSCPQVASPPSPGWFASEFTASLLANSVDEVPNGTTYVRTSTDNVDPATGKVTSFQGQGALATVNQADTVNIVAGAVNSSVSFTSTTQVTIPASVGAYTTVATAAPDSTGGFCDVRGTCQMVANVANTAFSIQIVRNGVAIGKIGAVVTVTGTNITYYVEAIDTSPDPAYPYTLQVSADPPDHTSDSYCVNIYLVADHRKV